MITKHQVLKELKEKIVNGDFLEYVVEQKNNNTYHQIRFGSGISISIDEKSRNMYINFAFNRNEKAEVLEMVKKVTPLIRTVETKPKQSFLKRLFSRK